MDSREKMRYLLFNRNRDTTLCSFLIETIQSYWDGLPSTHKRELQDLKKYNPPAEYLVPKSEWPAQGGATIFERFFANPVFAPFFPNVDAGEYYRNIRNGLLHQAQTKGGWLILSEGPMWDDAERAINRNLFARAVEKAFEQYLRKLELQEWDSDVWRRARRKTWWLVTFSTTAPAS